jgi:hypothetical protein
MSTMTVMRKSEVGELRPSQLLHTFGIGSVVDLPSLSVMVMGMEDWPIAHSREIGEERLLSTVQSILGPQVVRLLTPPRAEETVGSQTNWFDDFHTIGVPVAPFPRWLVCSSCRLLAPLSSDDFPWLDYVHRGKQGCPGPLRLYEVGPTGEASDVEVACDRCGDKRRMAEAFGRDNQLNMPACRGRRPHLRDYDPNGCDVPNVTPILQGASNSWFPVMVSALSVPQAADKLSQLVEDNWTVVEKATGLDVIRAFRLIGQLKDFVGYSDEEVWEAVQQRAQGGGRAAAEPQDLKSPEWNVFSNPDSAQEGRDFRPRAVEPPDGYENVFDKIVLVERLREVRALIGFTRIASARDFDSPFELPEEQRAPLSRRDPTWVPSSETRGEGIFFHFSEQAIRAWTNRTTKQADEFVGAHRRWRESRNLDPSLGFPGMRYVLLHSFAHAVIRQLAVECGYNTASISERIYSRSHLEEDPMAGVLIYTSAPDSEGTLGGLCALGKPDRLGWHLAQALDMMRLCASDPLCAEHRASTDATLHGAACHACTFLPETSCERGNKYLDRSVLVETVEREDLAFFR